MDASAFDRLATMLVRAGSRRAALLTTAGAALGLAGTDRAAAQPSCSLKANGESCQSGAECCSGRCTQRHRDDRYGTCRQADHQGICTVENNHCAGTSGACGTDCLCFVTTRGRSFCGGDPSGSCNCASNRQCERRHGKGSTCVQAGGINCRCETFETACMEPCENLDPVP
jgi:hypothetical protein